VLLQINADNPQMRKIQYVVDCLRDGGIVIYPTDTVYAMGCDIHSKKALERICKLKGIKPEKSNLSIICRDLSQLSEYTMQLDNSLFRTLKKALPGAYTFILKANSNVPKLFKNKKRTIGVRVPDNNIVQAIIAELGNPILTTSLKTDDDIIEYPTDPIDIHEEYRKIVDMIVDGGIGGLTPSTVVDCTDYEPEVVREGAGDTDILL